jgi:hypothetical protein
MSLLISQSLVDKGCPLVDKTLVWYTNGPLSLAATPVIMLVIKFHFSAWSVCKKVFTYESFG